MILSPNDSFFFGFFVCVDKFQYIWSDYWRHHQSLRYFDQHEYEKDEEEHLERRQRRWSESKSLVKNFIILKIKSSFWFFRDDDVVSFFLEIRKFKKFASFCNVSCLSNDRHEKESTNHQYTWICFPQCVSNSPWFSQDLCRIMHMYVIMIRMSCN